MVDNQGEISEKRSSAMPGGVRELAAVALPMVVSHACDTVMTFTDRIFLSRLGPEQMNASMAGGLTSFMMMTFFLGLVGYSTALVAQYLGAQQKDRCAKVVTQAAIICLAAYPLILLARPLVMYGFDMSGISAEQLASQKVYFNILIYATIIGLLRTCMSGFFSGIGKTKMVMIASLVAMVANVGLNYVLIFGHLGMPAMGIRGAAYGTVVGGLLGLGVLVAAYFWPSIRHEYQVLGSFHFDRQIMGKLLRFGYPAGVEMFLNLLAFTTMIFTFHACGPATATATTIMFNWDMVSFVPLLGIQIGVMSLVGRYMGAGTPDTAHRSTMSGLKVGWIYSSIILVLFLCIPKQLVLLFAPAATDEIFNHAIPMAVFMVRFAAIYVLIDTTVVVFSGALRGAGDTFWAMCISVGLHWFLVPLLIVMLHYLKMSPESAWVALVFTFLLFSLFFYLRYRSGRWREIRVVQSPEELLAADHDLDFHEPSDL